MKETHRNMNEAMKLSKLRNAKENADREGRHKILLVSRQTGQLR
jgi:hypothetical protein